MNSCLFCKIAKKEIPSRMVYEDDAVVAILDIHPCAAGHTVVIPKSHVETVLSLGDNEIGPVFQGVKRVTDKLLQTLKPDGFTIGVNHGKYAGQAIEHLHVHIIPRWSGDGGSSIQGIARNISGESIESVFAKIVGTP